MPWPHQTPVGLPYTSINGANVKGKDEKVLPLLHVLVLRWSLLLMRGFYHPDATPQTLGEGLGILTFNDQHECNQILL